MITDLEEKWNFDDFNSNCHLQDTGNSCLNITNNYVDHYCSWLPYGGHTIRDTEIGINASVAEALGDYSHLIYTYLCRSKNRFDSILKERES